MMAVLSSLNNGEDGFEISEVGAVTVKPVVKRWLMIGGPKVLSIEIY